MEPLEVQDSWDHLDRRDQQVLLEKPDPEDLWVPRGLKDTMAFLENQESKVMPDTKVTREIMELEFQEFLENPDLKDQLASLASARTVKMVPEERPACLEPQEPLEREEPQAPLVFVILQTATGLNLFTWLAGRSP